MDILGEPIYINLKLWNFGAIERSMIARGRNGKGEGGSGKRYKIWNYLQARPISYQKAIKSFRDLEITSTPSGILPGEWSIPPRNSPSSTLPPHITSLQRRRDACRLSDFFPLYFQHFSSGCTSPPPERRSTSGVQCWNAFDKKPPPRPEDPSSSSSFSFSCNHLDGRFLFSCSKRFIVSVDCLNQRFSTGTKSKEYSR